MKNIYGMKEANFRNYIDNNFVNAIKKGNKPKKKRKYPFNASGNLPFGPGTRLVYPNGATYIIDYENNLRYYGWDYHDSSAIPASYDVLIQYNPVNSEGWFGRKITETDPLIVTAPVTDLQQAAAEEASAGTETSAAIVSGNKKYTTIGIAAVVIIGGFLLWKYRGKLFKK